MNMALKRFINDWNINDGTMKIQTKRYATSKDLLGYFNDITPDNQQYIITKLFESLAELEINQDTILKN